jgi:hypothetical protein
MRSWHRVGVIAYRLHADGPYEPTAESFVRAGAIIEVDVDGVVTVTCNDEPMTAYASLDDCLARLALTIDDLEALPSSRVRGPRTSGGNEDR